MKSEVYFASHFTTLNSSIYQFISFQDVESAQIVKSVHTQVNGHDHDIIQSWDQFKYNLKSFPLLTKATWYHVLTETVVDQIIPWYAFEGEINHNLSFQSEFRVKK